MGPLTDLDLQRLRQRAEVALAIAIVYSASIILALTVGRLVLDPVRDREFIGRLGQFDAVALVVLGVLVCRWIKTAYEAVIRVHSIEPKYSPTLVSVFCFFSFLCYYIPLFFWLDFLLSKSDPRDLPTITWSRIASRFPLANAFLVTSFLSLFGSAAQTGHWWKSSLDPFIPGLFLVCAVLLGARIAFVVNGNLAKSVTVIQTRN